METLKDGDKLRTDWKKAYSSEPPVPVRAALMPAAEIHTFMAIPAGDSEGNKVNAMTPKGAHVGYYDEEYRGRLKLAQPEPLSHLD